jgi:hypothetical protein
MKKLCVAVASIVALIALPAGATSFLINVTLDGPQAGTTSTGTGSATMTLDDVANTLQVSLTFSGLLGTTLDAHIHCCSPPGVNSGVVIPFNPPFPLGVTSGVMNNLFNISPLNVARVKTGGAYINIHTTNTPGGEIRGQIAAIPEPSTLLLVGAGLIAVGLRRSRRA